MGNLVGSLSIFNKHKGVGKNTTKTPHFSGKFVIKIGQNSFGNCYFLNFTILVIIIFGSRVNA